MDQGFVRQIAGYSLTTAEILYRLPDHPKLLQSYVWQDYDLAPTWRGRSTGCALHTAG